VIGIISVLIGILLPALTSAREQSRKTGCLANLRTLGQMMILYSEDHRGRLPNSNPRNTTGTAKVLIVLASDYVKSPGTFYCPSDADTPPTEIVTDEYEMPDSARTSYDFYSVWWLPERGPRWSRLKGGRAPLAWDLCGGAAKFQSTHVYHMQNHGGGGGNVVHADGHGEWQPASMWDNGNFPNPASEYYEQ